MALSKFPKPGIRPICNTDAWQRLAAKGLGTVSDAQFQAFFQESQTNALQFGGNTRNGATNMFHLLSSVAESSLMASVTRKTLDGTPLSF